MDSKEGEKEQEHQYYSHISQNWISILEFFFYLNQAFIHCVCDLYIYIYIYIHTTFFFFDHFLETFEPHLWPNMFEYALVSTTSVRV